MNSPAPSTSLSRRDFLARTALGVAATTMTANTLGAAATANSTTAAATSSAVKPKFQIAGFEKHFFEKYEPEQLAQTYDEIGIDVEFTVRPEGHVKPENAADRLPAFAAALAQKNRKIMVVAASFLRPDEPHLVSTLRTAAKLGIPYYRHRGFRYAAGKPIKEQLANFRSQLREFAAINREIGIKGLFQNHAGADYVGAAIWDLDLVLDGIDPDDFGVALDARHLLVEQGMAWPTAIKLIAPRVRSLFVKSFKWDRNRPVETPLADGIVTKSVIDQIAAGHPSLPVCLHVEHLKLEPVAFANRAATVEAFRADARVLQGWLGRS